MIGAVACRYCINKSNKDLLEAQKRVQRSKEFKINPETEYGDQELDDLRKGKLGYDLNSYGSVDRESHASAFNTKQALNEYEVQYDPNNDYAIFGIGDQTRGG